MGEYVESWAEKSSSKVGQSNTHFGLRNSYDAEHIIFLYQ